LIGTIIGLLAAHEAWAQDKKPNIVAIMGDDIGMWNIGAYHRGLMAGRTPNLDKIAKEGMLFTDYYAEASCTAGRANFITGELPIRTGMTTVGQAGAKTGIPAQAVTIATVLKSMGYATGQFGKNHLGDLNEFLPTVHGFDEFFGYLYHLDAMEDPAHPNYPQNLLNVVGPRNMVHSWATDNDDPTEMPPLGQDRQAKDRGCRPALSETDGNGGRRDSRSRNQIHRQGPKGRQAVLRLAQPDAHAHRHASLPEV
jgi:arylsulfatase